MHKHLRRLESIWIDWPIYFITTCTSKRRSILALKEVAKILVDEWRNAHDRHGWAIGRYVMPDHVHFFCSAELDAKALPTFMQAWKQWTSKRMAGALSFSGHIWQEEFLTTFCDPVRATVRSGITSERIRCVVDWLLVLINGHGKARSSR